MASNSEASSGGIGFCGALCLLFIGLKLGGVINWSWVWVLSPLWIPFCLVAGIGLIVLAVVGIIAGVATIAKATK